MTPPRRSGSGGWPERRPRRPGPGPRRTAGRKPFGATWWGRAWTEALEQRASLDPNRLPRGRTYARGGAVGALDLAAGEVTAPVQGSRPAPYQVRVRVRRFADEEWAAVLDALAGQVGHAAALLEGELVPEVAGDVRAVGLDLLPGPGEVQPRCSCPDWADPCKHAAAVCYLVADELDRDPFLLFLLRGKGRDELLAGVRQRRGAGPAGLPAAGEGPSAGAGWERDAGVLARDAWGQGAGTSAPVPALPAPPRRPGRPALLLDAAPPGSGVSTEALRALAADAARRAWELATAGREPALGLTADEDCARWAASMVEGVPASLDLDELADRSGVARRDLFHRALAWRSGGSEGLAALTAAWQPEASELDPGRAALGAGARASANRVTLGDRQLRLGRDGRWYPYRKARGAWQPDGEPMLLDRREPGATHTA